MISVLTNIKNVMYKMKIVIFKKNVTIRNGVKINKNTFFEGNNLLAKNVVFKDSRIGYASYIGNDSIIYNSIIGKYTCIGPYVKFIIGQHPTNYMSIHPAFYSTKKQVGFTYVEKNKFNEFRYADNKEKKSIVIGNDVWICADVKIIDGVTINDGAIVLPGAVVTQDIPPYAIVGGVPANIIKFRFDKKDINWLLELKWWNKDEKWVQEHANLFDNIEKYKNFTKSFKR